MTLIADQRSRVLLSRHLKPGQPVDVREDSAGRIILTPLTPASKRRRYPLTHHFRALADLEIKPDNAPVEPVRL